MKKSLIVISLILSVMILSCASKPITTQDEANNAFSKIYQQFQGDIILDGAGHYTVQSGDTLSKIANANYSDSRYFPLIMLASSDVGVSDPDLIQPGMNLTIPDLQKNLADAKAKGKIKSFLHEVAKLYDRRDGRAADATALRNLAGTL